MTENKRFKEVYPNIIRSNYNFTDNGKGISDKEVCDLLNALHEENEHLNDTVDNITNHLQEVLEENAKLLQERNYFERKKTEYLTKLNECRLDNTDLTNK